MEEKLVKFNQRYYGNMSRDDLERQLKILKREGTKDYKIDLIKTIIQRRENGIRTPNSRKITKTFYP